MGIQSTAATGSKGTVKIGQQAVFGRFVQPTHFTEFTSEGIQATEEVLESEGIRGNRARNDILRGQVSVGGDLNFELPPDGLGMLIYNALGDYLRMRRVDGGYHARRENDRIDSLLTADLDTGAPPDIEPRFVMELSPEALLRFDNNITTADSTIAYVFRDGNGNLVGDDNSGSGYEIHRANARVETYVLSTAVANTAWSSALFLNVPNGTPTVTVADTPVAAIPIVLAPVVNDEGDLVNAVLAPEGVLRVGDARIRVRYIARQELAANAGVRVWLHPDDAPTLVTPVANDVVIVSPSLSRVATSFTIPAGAGKGAWVYKYLDAVTYATPGFDRIYTHHMEAGTDLPPGVTVEVDRDAAIFVYNGMKVNTLTANFETNAILTLDFAMLGQREYAMAELVEDAIPAQTSIVVKSAEHFPVPTGPNKNILQDFATITLDKETAIRYTTVVDNTDGTRTLGGIPSSGVHSIERMHLKGGNVDLRTSIARSKPETYVITVAGTVLVAETFTVTVDGTPTVVTGEVTPAGVAAELAADLTADGAGVYRAVVNPNNPAQVLLTGADGLAVTVGTNSVGATISSVRLLAVHEGSSVPMVMFEASFYMDGAVQEVLSGSLNLENNLNTDKFGAGSRFVLELIPQRRMVGGNLNVEFDDGTNYLKFINGTFFFLEVACVSDAPDDCGEKDETGIPNQMYFILPAARFGGTTPNIEGEDYITHDLPVMGRFDQCKDTPDMVVIAVNRAAYDVVAYDGTLPLLP